MRKKREKKGKNFTITHPNLTCEHTPYCRKEDDSLLPMPHESMILVTSWPSRAT